ncbi:hypothetical protein M0R04_03190 [Candidatus Dojkabacteria bacterium]|jgi:hypothetical protein|nr:hypothetical protein [Candidatus Dojkabacteria bacterium]
MANQSEFAALQERFLRGEIGSIDKENPHIATILVPLTAKEIIDLQKYFKILVLMNVANGHLYGATIIAEDEDDSLNVYFDPFCGNPRMVHFYFPSVLCSMRISKEKWYQVLMAQPNDLSYEIPLKTMREESSEKNLVESKDILSALSIPKIDTERLDLLATPLDASSKE